MPHSPHPAASPDQLTEQFGIEGRLRFEEGPGGLCRAVVTHPAATGEMYNHGAHVSAWQPRGRNPVLFMSGSSQFAENEPIRGGVPICFPWFGPNQEDPDAPMHGLIRRQPWQVESARQDETGLTLTHQTMLAPWRATHRVTFGSQLRMSLEIQNVGDADAAYEAAFHTYFRVGDVAQVEIAGLENTDYLDKTRDFRRDNQGDQPIRFAGETDRIYLDTQGTCTLRDPTMNRRIIVEKENSDTTVVWNPWIDKAARMDHYGDDEWPNMVCIETCNVGDAAVTLAPGAIHEMVAVVSVTTL